ncbi:hypothetical protein HaLaN_13732 [Haematococcus lacustris]|uniref:Uncharacterized protein n=1 Tax=Haematococcus lacustris TaxID=44745 RepID=A0A699ZMU6_HAELA|nr:hypothetical protein HaLaN_13732 [Haematococcus lacustris]
MAQGVQGRWVLTLIVLGSILFLTFASVALRASLRPGSAASLMGHASSEVGSAASLLNLPT